MLGASRPVAVRVASCGEEWEIRLPTPTPRGEFSYTDSAGICSLAEIRSGGLFDFAGWPILPTYLEVGTAKMSPADHDRSTTKHQLLDVAQELIQTSGYHAFSFKDVAARVGIKTASMHYHFPTKVDLATALLVRYRSDFSEALDGLGGRTALKRLDGLVGLFEATHDLGRMCLCGTLAADLMTLPEEVHAEVELFYNDLRDWIAVVLKEGMASGELRRSQALSTAEALLGLLEGALLSARVRRTAAPLAAARRWIRASLIA